jgi:hypothetical protein
MESILFNETETLGVRHSHWSRSILPRRAAIVRTEFGPITGKAFWRSETDTKRFSPEHDACADAAKSHGVTLRTVLEAARHAWKSGDWQWTESDKPADQPDQAAPSAHTNDQTHSPDQHRHSGHDHGQGHHHHH